MATLKSCCKIIINIRKLNSFTYIGRRGIARYTAAVVRTLNKRKKKMGPQPEPIRSQFLEWNYGAEIYAFNRRLSEEFNTELLEQALTHRSYVIREEMNQKALGIEDPNLDIRDNRELIEEGGKITSQVIQIYLSRALPRAPVECILSLHNHLMSPDVLANSSRHIGTKEILLTEEHPPSEETLANTFLALVSALSRSVDINHAGLFVRDFLIATLAEKDLTELWTPVNSLEILNDVLSREKRQPAEPRLIGIAGKNTLIPVYRVAVYSDKKYLGSGFGETVQLATEMAAMNTLLRLFEFTDAHRPIKFDMKLDYTKENEVQNLPITRWCRENIEKMAIA